MFSGKVLSGEVAFDLAGCVVSFPLVRPRDLLLRDASIKTKALLQDGRLHALFCCLTLLMPRLPFRILS